MTAPVPPYPHAGPAARPRRGRGLIIAGSVLLALSIVGGFAFGWYYSSQIDLATFDREVSVSGPRDRLVPGELEFRVPDDGDGSMRVGIAVSGFGAPLPECSLVDAAGSSIDLQSPMGQDELYDMSGRFVDWPVVGVATLEPGQYSAECSGGDGSAASGESFTVGRVFGFDDFSTFFGPLFGALAVGAIASVLFVLGLVLLIVGLVQRSRSSRPGPSGPYYGPPGGYGPPSGYGPPPGYAPQGPVPPPGYGAPGGPPEGSGAPGGFGPPAGHGSPAPPPPGYGPPGASGPPGYDPPGAPSPPTAPQAPTPGLPPMQPPPGPPGDSGPSGPPDDGDAGWTIPPSKR